MKKVVKLFVAMLLGIIWCVVGYILYLVFNIGMLLCYVHPLETIFITAYFMLMILYYFHKWTNGIWVVYLECGFSPIFLLVEGHFVRVLLMNADAGPLEKLMPFVYVYMPICLLVMFLASFIYKRRQKVKNRYKIIKINKSIFVAMFGFFCYFSATIIGSFIFSFELMMLILLPLVISYIIIAQKMLKREYRWMILFSDIVLLLAFLFHVCLLNAIASHGPDIDDLKDLIVPVLPYSIAVAIGELIVWISDKRKDSGLAKLVEGNIEPKKGWQVDRMEKKSKLLPIFISIPISILGYLIYYIVCKIAAPAFSVLMLFNTNHDYNYLYINVYAMVFVLFVLIAESYCMVMILIRFHKATNGMTVGYLEGCLLLWICGILGHTFISGQPLKLSTVLLLESDISILRDIRMMLLCLIVFGVSSLFYKIGQKKIVKGYKWKINKTMLIFLLTFLSCIVLIWVAFYIWMALTWQSISG